MTKAMIVACALVATLALSADAARPIAMQRVGDPAPIPGADALDSGFDAVTGEGNLMSIFEDDWSSTSTFAMPDSSGVTYSVPKNIKAAAVDLTQTKTNQCLTQTFDSWLHTYMSSFNIGISIGTSAFSLSANYNKEVGHVKNETSSETKAVDMSQFEVVPYKLEAFPYFVRKQSDMWSASVDALPETISTDQDKQMVTAFVQAFGTHFVTETTNGLRLNVDTFVDTSIFHEYTDDWVSTQMSLTFHYLCFGISAGGFKNKTDIHVSDDFKKVSKSTITYIGGDEALQTNSTLKEWALSVDKFPQALNHTLTETPVLVADSAKQAMLQAVNSNYLNKGSLPDAVDAVAAEHAAAAKAKGVELPNNDHPMRLKNFMRNLDRKLVRKRVNAMAARVTA